MITVKIGQTELKLQDVTESWINQQINRRNADGVSICVQVRIKEGDVDMIVSTPHCNGVGGNRLPSAREQRIFDLWEKLGLRRDSFHGGQVVAFLKQLPSML